MSHFKSSRVYNKSNLFDFPYLFLWFFYLICFLAARAENKIWGSKIHFLFLGVQIRNNVCGCVQLN